MAKGSGLGMGFDVDGVDYSGDINSFGKISGGPAGTMDVQGIDKLAYERLGLLRSGAVDFMAYFNPSAGQAHPKFAGLPTSDVTVGGRFSATLGDAGFGMIAKQIGYDPKRDKNGSLLIDIRTVCNSFGLEWGQQLTAGKRTDSTATNGTPYDYGATVGTTNFGLQMYVHLYAFTGTSVTIKIQSSSDNGADAYADVTGATTGALSAVGAVRVATAGNVAVERYLRVATTGTFSNAQFHVLAVRNMTAVSF